MKQDNNIKNIITASLAVALLGFAPALQADDKADAKAELLECLKDSDEAVEELLEPDLGCSVEITKTGFRIYARGAAAYDFSDSEEILDAKKEALLNAKTQMAKFLKEKVGSDEYVSKMADKMRESKLVDGKESLEVTKKECKRRAEVMRNSADAILKGFVVISARHNRDKKTVSYVGGVSDKTLKANGLLRGKLNELAANEDKVPGKPGSGTSKGGATKGESTSKGTDKRKAKGDF